jgi:hypothetical protein
MSRCLAIFHKQLGDLVLLEPTLRRLSRASGSKVDLITRSGFRPTGCTPGLQPPASARLPLWTTQSRILCRLTELQAKTNSSTSIRTSAPLGHSGLSEPSRSGARSAATRQRKIPRWTPIFGMVKGKFTGASPLKSGAQTILVGGLAAGAAYGLAKLIS